MKKFDKLKLGKIVLDSDTNKKFLDFKNNQDIFCDGTENEYYAALYDYIKRLIYNSRSTNEMILNKTFISNIIRILKNDVLVQNKLKELVYLELIHYLFVYYDTINIIRLTGCWPYTEEENKDVKKEAITLLKTQKKEIEDFLKEIEYDKKVSELLERFKEQTTMECELSNDDFNDLELIFTTAHNIPQEYIDLYFRNVMKYSKRVTTDSLRNAFSSLVRNQASSYGTYCFLDICPLKIGTLGSYEYHVITVSDRTFSSFYLNQLVKKRNIFDTIFHELTHLLQEKLYEKENLPYEYILMIEDYLLSNTLTDKYTTNNYMSLYNEIDARRLGSLKTDEYLRTLGIIPKENTLRAIERDERKHKKDTRYYNREEKSVDVLFDENIQEVIKVLKVEFKIDIFTDYPVLNYLYHKDGRRKTTLELIKEKSRTTSEEVKNLIDEILKNRKLSKENISKDLKELVLDSDLSIEDDKSRMIEQLNTLLTTKERSKLLVSLDSISIKLKEFVRGFAILCGELNEIELESNIILIDRVMEHKFIKDNTDRD